MFDRLRWVIVLLLAATAACSSDDADKTAVTTTTSAPASPEGVVVRDGEQALAVRYLDQSNPGTRRWTVLTVPTGTPVERAEAPWRPEWSTDCNNDGATLTLAPADGGSRIQLGEDCAWSLGGPVSPDGRYLAAWQPWDGAASTLHLVELSSEPRDLGEVPHSTSANYAAAWTADGRIWFTWNHSAEGMNQLWSFTPGSSESEPTDVPGSAVVDAVVVLDA